MASTLSPTQWDLITEFGNIYEAHGFKRLKGLIVGLLLIQADPVSLDEIARLLNRSKGPISTAARELANLKIVRKVEGPENRRDYYTLDPDVFFMNFKANMVTVHKNKILAERYLQKLEAENAIKQPVVLRRLKQMRQFYTLMESFYVGFEREWEMVKDDEL